MAGSGAGLVRSGNLGGTLILATNGSTNTDSGPVLASARGFTKWTIQSVAGAVTWSGITITIYGTTDTYTAGIVDAQAMINSGNAPAYAQSPLSSNTNWFQLPMQAQAGTDAAFVNPITAPNQVCVWIGSGPLVAIRAAVTATPSASGTAYIIAFASD